MKRMLFLLTLIIAVISCQKKNDEAPNKFIDEQAGTYLIETLEKYSYQNNELTGKQSFQNVGKIVFDVVNFGFVSEGSFERDVAVSSLILDGMDAANPCTETFRWTGDEERITFVLGWCTQQTIYTLTLDGFKRGKQTWTLVTTDASGNITAKEVFKVNKQ